MNWWKLFAGNLHVAAELAYQFGRLTYGFVRDQIIRRGLDPGLAHPSTVYTFNRQVQRAVESGMDFTAGRRVEVLDYGRNPTQMSAYHYGVLVRIDDPDNPSRMVSIPWRIDSDLPLDRLELNRRVAMDLAEWQGDRDTDPTERAASWIRKDMRAIFWRDRWIAQGDLPPWDVEVIAAYRRD